MEPNTRAFVVGVLGLTTLVACAALVYARRSGSKPAPASGKDAHAPTYGTHRGITGGDEAAKGVSGLEHSTLTGKTAGKDDGVTAGAEPDASTSGEGAASRDAPADEAAGTPVTGGSSGSGAASEEGAAGDGEHDDLVAKFNSANSMARKFFKAQRYDQAAEQYGIALSLCDKLPNHESKRTALHNNRGAAFEKDGKFALALSECAMCLARDPAHPLARVRKSRVLEAMGKLEDALAEVCAHLLLERDRMQAKAAMNPLQALTPPAPPANLEGLLEKIAKDKAEKVLKEREEAEQREKQETGVVKLQPLNKQAVTELLRSFGSFAQLERRCKGIKEGALTRELQADVSGNAGGDDNDTSPPSAAVLAERVLTLRDRAMVRIVKRNYDGAREDIFEAVRVMNELQANEPAEGCVLPADVEMAVLEWQGTFLQIATDVDGAMEAYEKAGAAAEAQGEHWPADLLIKMAWAHMDKDNKDKAKTYFARAMEVEPDYGTSYAHRSRLEAEGEGLAEVVELNKKALSLNKSDVYAWEHLAKVYVQHGDVDKALETADEGLKAVPKAEGLLVLKAELKYSMAVRVGNASTAPEILALFDEAIKSDPLNPMLYMNKASCLMQMMNDVAGAMEVMETAVSVDPSSVSALVQLANLKIMVAKAMDEAHEATRILDKAVALCHTKQDLTDTLSVLAAAEGRIKGAQLLGRSALG